MAVTLRAIQLFVPIPDGFEATKEWRPPKEDEFYLNEYGAAGYARADQDWGKGGLGNRIILRQVRIPRPGEVWGREQKLYLICHSTRPDQDLEAREFDGNQVLYQAAFRDLCLEFVAGSLQEWGENL